MLVSAYFALTFISQHCFFLLETIYCSLHFLIRGLIQKDTRVGLLTISLPQNGWSHVVKRDCVER